MTVSELLARADSRELSEWMAFYEFEPFGSEAFYYGHAMTASAVLNVNKKKGAKPVKPADLLPPFGKQKREQGDISQAIGWAAAMTAALGGKDER